MSRRREAVERGYEREQAAIDQALERGDIGPDEHREQTRALEREARAELRQAEADDVDDVRRDYGGW